MQKDFYTNFFFFKKNLYSIIIKENVLKKNSGFGRKKGSKNSCLINFQIYIGICLQNKSSFAYKQNLTLLIYIFYFFLFFSSKTLYIYFFV